MKRNSLDKRLPAYTLYGLAPSVGLQAVGWTWLMRDNGPDFNFGPALLIMIGGAITASLLIYIAIKLRSRWSLLPIAILLGGMIGWGIYLASMDSESDRIYRQHIEQRRQQGLPYRDFGGRICDVTNDFCDR